MSVLTILAYALSGIAAKFVSPQIENTQLQAKVDELERQLKSVERDRDRWESLSRSWQLRYEILSESPTQARSPYEQGLRLADAIYQQQAWALQAAHSDVVGILGAQGLQLPAEWCNCVPARHDVLRPRVEV